MSRTAVRPEPNAEFDPKATNEWLDGLAGRGGDSTAAREAAALRAALKPSDAELDLAKLPAWEHIVAAADRLPASTSRPGAGQAGSANESRWKRFATGGVAAVVLVAGLCVWVFQSRHGDVADGMRGSPSTNGAVWKTQNPAAAARELATRLESVGARVNVTLMNDAARLDAECGSASAQRINQELAAVEVAVDSNCRLSLQIMQAR